MSTANANSPHQRWTRQLLSGSALLPRPSTMDTPATSRKRPASSPLNVKACQPTCSVRSISPPRARRCLALGSHPPTDNEVMLYQYRKGGGGGGRNRARESVASRIQAPPPFCTEAKFAKGGAYLRDTTVLYNILPMVAYMICTMRLVSS